MKIFCLIFAILIIITCSLKADESGKGTLNVTVTHPVLKIYFNTNGNGNGSYQGATEDEGVLDLGTFYPPPLNECVKLDDGFYYKQHLSAQWANNYIPFVVEGAKGVSFIWENRAANPVLFSGEQGVILAYPNLKGSRTGILFNSIPQGGSFVAVLNDNEGKYYIQMHFADVWIRYACTGGTRVFKSIITCSYN